MIDFGAVWQPGDEALLLLPVPGEYGGTAIVDLEDTDAAFGLRALTPR